MQRFDDMRLSGTPQRLFATVRTNPATSIFVALNVVVFLYQWLMFGSSNAVVLYQMGAKFGPAIQDGDWYRLIMPIMLHGGWLHLAVNSLGLWMVGPLVERIFGSTYFAAIYVFAGIFGVVASYWNSPVLSVGASGALFGIVAAAAVYFGVNRRLLQNQERRFFFTLLVLIAGNLLIGEFIPGIDQAAHVGGLVAGSVIAFVAAPRHSLIVGRTLLGVPAPYIESNRAEPFRVLAAVVGIIALAAGVAWWVSTTVTYGSETMRQYGIFQLFE